MERKVPRTGTGVGPHGVTACERAAIDVDLVADHLVGPQIRNVEVRATGITDGRVRMGRRLAVGVRSGSLVLDYLDGIADDTVAVDGKHRHGTTGVLRHEKVPA